MKTEIIDPALMEKMSGLAALDAEDVSGAVLFALGTPPHVQIHELIIKPLGEMF